MYALLVAIRVFYLARDKFMCLPSFPTGVEQERQRDERMFCSVPSNCGQ